MASPPPQPVQPSGPAALPVFRKNNLSITMQISRNGPGASLLARFRNTSNFDRLTGVGLQAAVPKSQKLTLQAINRSVLEGGEEATQGMKIVGAAGALPPKLRLRLKISYAKDDGSAPIAEQVDWSEP